MKPTKNGKYLTTVPVIAWWLSNKIEKHRRKKHTESQGHEGAQEANKYLFKENHKLEETPND